MDRQSLPSRRGWLITTLAVVLEAAVAAGLLAACDSSGEDPTPDTPAEALQSSTPTSSPDAEQAIADCRRSWRTVRAALRTAVPTMKQWELHIDAMNQLVAGKITLAQAAAFWERTRIAARHHYHMFDAADERFRTRPASCAVPSTETSAADTATLRACNRAVAAGHATLAAARETLRTWSRHITEMNQLRAGTLSPARAQRLWIRVWKAGDADLRVYHQKERRSDSVTCRA